MWLAAGVWQNFLNRLLISGSGNLDMKKQWYKF